MTYRRCKKCLNKFRVINLVCCKNCNGYFDRKCAKELCDEEGEWAIPPTKLVKWSCTKCQTKPARVCCDQCSRTLHSRSAFVACGKCGRHACAKCAGFSAKEVENRESRFPWLCVQCCESPRDVPESWNNDKVFAEKYARYPNLWKPNATKEELEYSYVALGKAVGLESLSQLVQRCKQFQRKYKNLLLRLACRYRTSTDILRHAPSWIRETEQRLNWLPSIIQSTWWPDSPEQILHELSRRVRSGPAPGHDRGPAWVLRAIRALAARLTCPLHSLQDIWTQLVRVSLLKLQALSLVGDVESASNDSSVTRLSPHEWLAADAALLASDKRAEWLVGYLNSQLWVLLVLLRLVQQFRLEEREESYAVMRTRWVSAYKQYKGSGLTSSVIVLQRRWWELKVETHTNVRMCAAGRKRALLLHHQLVARRYPHVVTEPMPRWSELRKKKMIVDITEDQVKEFKEYVAPLPVADDDLILQEAKNFETADEPTASVKQETEYNPKTEQMVAQLRREVAELRSFDKMQNLSLEPLIQKYEDDLTQLSAFDEVDPKIASTSIIFESDSDEQTEGKSKSPVNTKRDSDCEVIEWKTETCELSDDSDTVFKDGESNIAVCIASSSKTKENSQDLENNEGNLENNEVKTESNLEMSIDAATDPKLRMVPIVPLVRVDEQNPNAGSTISQNVRIACQDAILALREELIGNKMLEDEDKKAEPEECSKESSSEDCNIPEAVKVSCQDAVAALKEDLIGVDENLSQPEECSKQSKISKDKNCQEAIMALHKDLIGYKIHDESETVDVAEPIGVVQPPVKLERPWGYAGPLKGRVEDLSWLCTSISIALEKLPEEVLNNVRANAANRRVWLPDIEQVRRDNKRMLVAQVAPLTHTEVKPPPRGSRSHSSESTLSSNSRTPSLEDFGVLTQPHYDKDFDEGISETQLRVLLDDLQETRTTGTYCCLARRHRACNDARRSKAARAGRGDAHHDLDLHGAKHGTKAACGCCCRHLLRAPQSLAVLQKVLAKSLEALLKRRGDTASESSDQLKRPHAQSSSSDDDRLVIDHPTAARPKKPNKKRTRKKKRAGSKKKTNANVESSEKPDAGNHKEQPKKRERSKGTNDESDEERKKRADYNEWERQKNSHRRFFEPPGSKDRQQIIFLSKKTELVSKEGTLCAKLSEPHRLNCQDHTYARDLNQAYAYLNQDTATSSQDGPRVAPLEIVENTDGDSTPIVRLVKPDSSLVGCKVLSSSDIVPQVNKTPMSSRGVIPQLNQTPVSSRGVIPQPNQTPMPQSSHTTPEDGQPSSYFIIYQQPKQTNPSGPSVSIVPLSLQMPPPLAQIAPEKDKKSIFQENFRQKMVHNLSLMSGGGLVTENETEDHLETSEENPLPNMDKPEGSSPRIFDELPPVEPNILNESPFFFSQAPFVPSLASLPIVTDQPIVAPLAPNLPVMMSSVPTVAANLVVPAMPIPNSPILAAPIPTVVPGLTPVISNVTSLTPTISNVMSLTPTISNVTSLSQKPSDDDDDDCVITSPPAPKTIIIQPIKKHRNQNEKVARFITPSSLYQDIPVHISTYVRGGDTSAFALLRVNSERRLWALPGGDLVLTDTAIACRNIKYFIINSKSLRRMVPVHFDKPEPREPEPGASAGTGRIQVRSFAKMAATPPAPPAPPAEGLDDMLTDDNKLYKRLLDDKPVYARVLTGITDVVSAELLAANGYALHVYRPRTDALLAVRARPGDHTLQCDDRFAAMHIAANFNYNNSGVTWKVLCDQHR